MAAPAAGAATKAGDRVSWNCGPRGVGKAGNIAARMGQTLNEALVDRFGDKYENDRH